MLAVWNTRGVECKLSVRGELHGGGTSHQWLVWKKVGIANMSVLDVGRMYHLSE